MPFVVIYDANVLHPYTLRSLLIKIAQAGLVQAKWSEKILDEMVDSVLEARPNVEPAKLRRTRDLMCQAVRDCIVTDYEPLIDILDLPDPDDRHVLAAAIKCHAQVIVTDNLKDFPADKLAPWGIEAKNSDDFVVDQLHLNRSAVYVALQQIADSHQNPPETLNDILDRLERNGLVEAVALLRAE